MMMKRDLPLLRFATEINVKKDVEQPQPHTGHPVFHFYNYVVTNAEKTALFFLKNSQ
jgi:hypothetical protein